MSQKFTLTVFILLFFCSTLLVVSCNSKKPQIAASEALEALRNMSSKVKTNLTLQEYKTHLNHMKAEVEKRQA